MDSLSDAISDLVVFAASAEGNMLVVDYDEVTTGIKVAVDSLVAVAEEVRDKFKDESLRKEMDSCIYSIRKEFGIILDCIQRLAQDGRLSQATRDGLMAAGRSLLLTTVRTLKLTDMYEILRIFEAIRAAVKATNTLGVDVSLPSEFSEYSNEVAYCNVEACKLVHSRIKFLPNSRQRDGLEENNAVVRSKTEQLILLVRKYVNNNSDQEVVVEKLRITDEIAAALQYSMRLVKISCKDLFTDMDRLMGGSGDDPSAALFGEEDVGMDEALRRMKDMLAKLSGASQTGDRRTAAENLQEMMKLAKAHPAIAHSCPPGEIARMVKKGLAGNGEEGDFDEFKCALDMLSRAKPEPEPEPIIEEKPVLTPEEEDGMSSEMLDAMRRLQDALKRLQGHAPNPDEKKEAVGEVRKAVAAMKEFGEKEGIPGAQEAQRALVDACPVLVAATRKVLEDPQSKVAQRELRELGEGIKLRAGDVAKASKAALMSAERARLGEKARQVTPEQMEIALREAVRQAEELKRHSEDGSMDQEELDAARRRLADMLKNLLAGVRGANVAEGVKDVINDLEKEGQKRQDVLRAAEKAARALRLAQLNTCNAAEAAKLRDGAVRQLADALRDGERAKTDQERDDALERMADALQRLRQLCDRLGDVPAAAKQQVRDLDDAMALRSAEAKRSRGGLQYKALLADGGSVVRALRKTVDSSTIGESDMELYKLLDNAIQTCKAGERDQAAMDSLQSKITAQLGKIKAAAMNASGKEKQALLDLARQLEESFAGLLNAEGMTQEELEQAMKKYLEIDVDKFLSEQQRGNVAFEDKLLKAIARLEYRVRGGKAAGQSQAYTTMAEKAKAIMMLLRKLEATKGGEQVAESIMSARQICAACADLSKLCGGLAGSAGKKTRSQQGLEAVGQNLRNNGIQLKILAAVRSATTSGGDSNIGASSSSGGGKSNAAVENESQDQLYTCAMNVVLLTLDALDLADISAVEAGSSGSSRR